jgi:hypothetical protein
MPTRGYAEIAANDNRGYPKKIWRDLLASGSPLSNKFITGIHPINVGFFLAPAPVLGESAVSLAPYLRRDVREAVLQVGRTLAEEFEKCQQNVRM